MSLIQIVAPTSEPVTVSETKRHLGVDIADDDDLIASYITVARHQAENYMKRQLRTATWLYTMRDFPGSTGHIELMRPPLSTVTGNVSIGYVDNNNSTQTLSATAYTVDYQRNPGRVYPTYNNDWPTDVLTDHPKSVQITYQTGYTDASLVPQPIKQFIMMRVGAMYEYRETISNERFTELGRDYTLGLLDPYKILRFAT